MSGVGRNQMRRSLVRRRRPRKSAHRPRGHWRQDHFAGVATTVQTESVHDHTELSGILFWLYTVHAINRSSKRTIQNRLLVSSGSFRHTRVNQRGWFAELKNLVNRLASDPTAAQFPSVAEAVADLAAVANSISDESTARLSPADGATFDEPAPLTPELPLLTTTDTAQVL